MSKYDKTVSISREEEGTYHRREYETSPARSGTVTHHQHPVTTYTTTKTYPVATRTSGGYSSNDDNFEEWTTSKRKVNHKTRQVETRVSRQLLVEDGRVIADSGPQVTTRIKEDNKVEECEKEKTPKNKGKFAAIENAPESSDSMGRVLGEKKEIQRVSREVREENMQYHDERFKELTGQDVHRRAIQAPHELITINDKDSTHSSKPRGKMVHYSNKGKKYQDTDEILEVAKLAIDGSITKEVKRTKYHEECSEDEKPDETGEAEELRNAPKVERSSRRHVDYVNDFDDTATPSCSSDEEYREVEQGGHITRTKGRVHSSSGKSRKGHSKAYKDDDPAFPRYKLDPLLNSLNDEDFKPATSGGRHGHEHSLERSNRYHSSDEETQHRPSSRQQQVVMSSRQRSQSPVEIPEEYRARAHKSSSLLSSGQQRERSFSPNSKVSHRNNSRTHHHSRSREDAGVQAHLTDEEIERRSMKSSSSSTGGHAHEKETRKLQRQSTRGSKRNYYFGDSRPRSPSVESASSASLSDPKERMRKHGARSRDSGFRSPHHHHRTATPGSAGSQQQIYSVSNKQQAKKSSRGGAISPTPTTGSAGQRSVKTTTTTMSAGLTDRPLSRSERSAAKSKSTTAKSNSKTTKDSSRIIPTVYERQQSRRPYNQRQRDISDDDDEARRSLDSVSLSSLGPNATTIKVPYRRVGNDKNSDLGHKRSNGGSEIESTDDKSVQKLNSEMSFQSDLESLSKRLENIKRQEQPHFDYKTIVADVQPAKHKQVIGAYNVHSIEQNSPFYNPAQKLPEFANNSSVGQNDNNNEANFVLENFLKDEKNYQMDDDQVSLVSSCSLRSSKTYNVRTFPTPDIYKAEYREPLEDERIDQFEIEQLECREFQEDTRDANIDSCNNPDDSKRPAAWIFDLRDGSSTTIPTPTRPRKPEAPKIDSKTEELARARGGQSYYLELVEREKDSKAKEEDSSATMLPARPRPASIGTLYTRSNSHGNLTAPTQTTNKPKLTAQPSKGTNSQESRRSRQMVPAKTIYANRKPIGSSASNSNLSSITQSNDALNNGGLDRRRQLPLSGNPLVNRSKSSSCLLTTPSTRCNKYSIYGGLKRADGTNKPVPRLSYSRTIGPKSQRQIDAQAKTPSRYLKLK